MKKAVVCSVVLCLCCAPVLWADDFQNRDFEDASLTAIPPGQSPVVSFADAIPYWTGYVGSNQESQVVQDDLALGGAFIGLMVNSGNSFTARDVIEGQYTVLLAAGAAYPDTVDVSLSQTGLVPANAKSVLLKVYGANFSVNFAGQAIALSTLGIGPNYILYGGDISSFAGQEAELTLTALQTTQYTINAVGFDAITFSTEAIPEPSAFALAISALMVVFGIRFRRS